MSKKKILFACLHRPGRSPSQRFRFEQYIESLTNEGYECQHSYLLDAADDKIYYSEGNLTKKLLIVLRSTFKRLSQVFFSHYDIVFVQRECFMLGTALFEKLFAKRSKLIYDFDDSIWINQTGEIKSKNKMFYFLKNPAKTAEIIKVADMVFAGNEFLAAFASTHNSNVKIVPTTIDTDLYQPVKVDSPAMGSEEPICIGWSGSFSTIIHFQHIEKALQELKKQLGNKISFKVIGDESYENYALGIKGMPWKLDSEIEDLSGIDIGLMPLPDDKWTEGKCGLKGLQYMALSIPTIMSPVGVNKKIINDGYNGFLASTHSEWVEKIATLINDHGLRREIGKRGRETVERYYSVKSITRLYKEYFNDVLN